MKKIVLILFCLCSVGWGQEKVNEDNSPALTIYNQNFFVAREHFPLDLTAGVNHVNYSGVAAHLEPDSVILRDPAGRALQVLEQNYRNDPISQELLLSFYEGKTIDFRRAAARMTRTSSFQGKSCAAATSPAATTHKTISNLVSTQPIIEVNGVLRFGLPGQPLFPALIRRFDSETHAELAAANQPARQVRRGDFLRQRRHELAGGLQPGGFRYIRPASSICSTWSAG